MFTIRTLVYEVIHQLYSVTIIWFEGHPRLIFSNSLLHDRVISVIMGQWVLPLLLLPECRDLIKYFNLVKRSFNVMLRWLLNLECNVRIIHLIFCKPNCWEMSPPQFLNDHISAFENLAYMNRMVTSHLVIWKSLILTRVTVLIADTLEELTTPCPLRP